MSTVSHAFPWVMSDFVGAREEQGGRNVRAACPLGCHQDGAAKLWFSVGSKGNLLFRCWGKDCNKLEILRAVGRGWKDVWPATVDWNTVPRKIVARYPYFDAAGKLLYMTLRYEPGRNGRDKEFRQRRPDPTAKGGWVYNLDGVERVLYRLPEIMAASHHRVIAVVGGEKDADELARIGILATTNVCGETAPWLDSYSEALRGRRVVVVEDGDATGRRHANEVVGSLLRAADSVRLASLPDKDATAFINRHKKNGVRRHSDLQQLFREALLLSPEWLPVRMGVVARSAG